MPVKLIEFPEQTHIIAKLQPEYLPLPAHRFNDEQGRIACCWSLTWRERIRLLFTGRIWHQVLTFDLPLQPQLLTVEKPAMERQPVTTSLKSRIPVSGAHSPTEHAHEWLDVTTTEDSEEGARRLICTCGGIQVITR